MSLADVYDALVSKRCYKEKYPKSVAMKMILNGECGSFNPRLLEYFCQAEPVLSRLYFPTGSETG